MTRTAWGSVIALTLSLGCGGGSIDGGDTGEPAGDCVGMDDGASCGTDRICLGEVCADSTCGDGFVDPARGEECEDGNDVANDGCQPVNCVFTCHPSSSECDDMTACNGIETCSASHRCEDAPDLDDGTECELDDGGDGVCRTGMCVPRGCTDMIQNGTETDEDCGGGACPACGEGGVCVANSDCIQYFGCPAGTCVRDAESDCLDGIDNNGDGLADCQDPTCTQVACVPGGPSGSQLGVVSGSCPSGFASGFPVNSGFHEGSCGGCTCSASAQCRLGLDIRGAPSVACSGTPVTAITTTGTAGQTGNCLDHANANADQIYSGGVQTVPGTQVCSVGGSPTYTSSPYWDVSTNFCPADRTSDTCSSGQVCAPIPPSTMCINVPGNVGCPPGYSAPTLYYSSFTAGGCNACPGTCSAGTNICGYWVETTSWTDSCCGCAFGAAAGPFLPDRCSGFTARTLSSSRTVFPINAGDCSVNQPLAIGSTLNAASTVCCR